MSNWWALTFFEKLSKMMLWVGRRNLLSQREYILMELSGFCIDISIDYGEARSDSLAFGGFTHTILESKLLQDSLVLFWFNVYNNTPYDSTIVQICKKDFPIEWTSQQSTTHYNYQLKHAACNSWSYWDSFPLCDCWEVPSEDDSAKLADASSIIVGSWITLDHHGFLCCILFSVGVFFISVVFSHQILCFREQ